MTGCCPLPVFGSMVAPQRIASCQGALDSSVVHTLCYCTSLANLREDVRVRGRLPPPASQSAFLLGLFRDGAPAEVRALHIEFVGRALGFAAGPSYVAAVDAELEVELLLQFRRTPCSVWNRSEQRARTLIP